MFGRKGQSALEYLMTYGWAILIIIVVGGVLYYYGVFSPGKIVGESKTGFSKVQVDTWGIDTSGNLQLVLENRVGSDINITQIEVKSGTKTDTYTPTGGIPLTAGQRSDLETVTLTNNKLNAGDTYKFDVTITYYLQDYGPGTTFRSTGMLSGTA
ncbi:MAG: hypothetical protein J7K87_00930 [Candidatus Aenigmarchaeota archaeon]|nr:hypothetical protein [Candidatus Aenigmarchaeota archaeon]